MHTHFKLKLYRKALDIDRQARVYMHHRYGLKTIHKDVYYSYIRSAHASYALGEFDLGLDYFIKSVEIRSVLSIEGEKVKIKSQSISLDICQFINNRNIAVLIAEGESISYSDGVSSLN